MNGTTDIHPNVVLESLLAKGSRSHKRSNLLKMHELCRKQYEAGSRDFSLPAIGRLAEADGILKGRALYNAQSADYRALVGAWAAYAGPPMPKPPKTLASYEYLMRIEDPALRSVVQTIIVERDKLKAQINVLKEKAQVTIDRRPIGATITTTPGTQPIAVLELSARLTPSEREALQKAVSADYLKEQGLREGNDGEIVNERNRIVFDVRFAHAIRKVLGATGTPRRSSEPGPQYDETTETTLSNPAPDWKGGKRC